MITVKEFNSIGSDERGETKSFTIKDYGQFVYLKRKKGSLCGNSYHRGINEGTRIKTFILLKGGVTINYRHVDSHESESMKVTAPSIIEVEPFTVHNMYMESDVLILENNSITDIQEDVVREKV